MLFESDVVVSLVTRRSIDHEWTTVERGMAVGIQRLHQRGTIIPVLLETLQTEDEAKTGVNRTPKQLEADYKILNAVGANNHQIAEWINDAISSLTDSPTIFIAHSHSDRELAEALRSLLEQALDLGPKEIRVTSLQGGKLPIGSDISRKLRQDIIAARVVLVLVTPDSVRSEYVLFELGASWVLDKRAYPLLGHGTTDDDLPGPFKGRESIVLAQAASCQRLLNQIQDDAHVRAKKGVGDRVEDAIQNLNKIAGLSKPSGSQVP